MCPLDQVSESLISNCFEDGNYVYQSIEQTVEEFTKCFLLEYGDNKEFSFGRCRQGKSFNDLFEGLKNIK